MDRGGKDNIQFLRCALCLMSVHTWYDCARFLLHLAGSDWTGFIFLIYLLQLLYAFKILLEHRLRVGDVLAVGMWYLLYGAAYLIGSDAQRACFADGEVQAVLLFYLPLSLSVVTRVRDWTAIFRDRVCMAFIDGSIVLSFLSKLAGSSQTNYMSFSYHLLPFCCLAFLAACAFGKKGQWGIAALGGLANLIYGARGSLLFFGLFCVLACLMEALNARRDRPAAMRALLKGGTLAAAAALGVHTLLPALLRSEFAAGSYVLRRIRLGSLTDSAGRDRISACCREALRGMGLLDVNGLFYDRTILADHTYAHNVIYEVLLSFGWILGGIFLLALAALILCAFARADAGGRLTWLFLVCGFFLRYFISGSIFDEGNFYIFIAGIISLKQSGRGSGRCQSNREVFHDGC